MEGYNFVGEVTVSQLISELEKIDKDLKVCIKDSYGAFESSLEFIIDEDKVLIR